MTTIEKATTADFAAIAEIYNEHIRLNRSTMIEEEMRAAHIQKWVDNFHDREELHVLRSGENKVIGWGLIKRYSDRFGYRFTCETSVFLTQKETGKGHGSRMKKFLLDRCQELKYHHLVAKIFAENTGSIKYNERLGYTIVGRQKEIGWKNGKWVDVVIMQYVFPK